MDPAPLVETIDSSLPLDLPARCRPWDGSLSPQRQNLPTIAAFLVDRQMPSPIKPVNIDELPDVELVTEGILRLPRRHITLLAGYQGSGKSSFAHALGLHAAYGRDIAGIRFPRPLRVLYLDYERAPETAKASLLATAATLGLSHNTPYYAYAPMAKSLTEIKEAFIQAETLNYDLVLVDSFERSTALDSNDSAAVRLAMDCYNELAQRLDVGLVLLEHTPKTNQSTIFGSTKKMDAARAIYLLEESKAPGELVCKEEKFSFGAKREPVTLVRSWDDGMLSFTLRPGEDIHPLPGQATKAPTPQLSPEYQTVLDMVRERGTVPRGELVRALMERHGMSEAGADKALRPDKLPPELLRRVETQKDPGDKRNTLFVWRGTGETILFDFGSVN